MTSRKRHINVLFEPVLVSSAMRRLDRTLQGVAQKDVAICLVGESGSGKEILARRVHELSPRRAQPFVPINCAAIPEALFESELFGHERGAFTGANQLAKGKIEAAAAGTLFLDEIGELPLAVQPKLLRFLENYRFMRVGGNTKISADVRLVCATLRPLEEEVRAGRFRADLYYRIQGITLQIPPLRERRDDIGPLIDQLTAQLAARHSVDAPRIARATMSVLRAHSWPGNVRELRNAVEQMCVLRGGKIVRPSDLPATIRVGAAAAPKGGAADGDANVVSVRIDQPLDESVNEIIRAAVAAEHGNRSRAAHRLEIGLRTIQRRLRERG